MSEEERKREEQKKKEQEEKGYKVNVKKKVDDSYKEAVKKEKGKQEKKVSEESEEESAKGEAEEGQELPEVNFPMFISSLGMQAMMSLGEVENPMTKKKEVNLEQAKYFVDILKMLKDKTEGNLNSEEQKVVDDLIYQLQMKYVEKSKE